jgi:short-subunit dehydrogenase
VGVALAALNKDKAELDAVAEATRRSGSDSVVLPADLSLPAEAFRVVAEAEKALGRLDLVVAGAGIAKIDYLVNQPWKDIEQTVMVNTIGAMALIRAALPGMIRQGGGYIAGISSLSSYRATPMHAAYCSSKAALSIFLESMRVEMRTIGISVIDIHPGPIRTPMSAADIGPRPFVMDVDDAARCILCAIVRKKPVYDFPWQMALLAHSVRILPTAIFDRLPRSGLLMRILKRFSDLRDAFRRKSEETSK